MLGNTGASTFSAGEAVGPNAMSPEEFSATPGARGGEAPANAPIDWMKMLQGGLSGFSQMPSRGGMALPSTTMQAVPSPASPIDFNTVVAFLQSIGLGGKPAKGGR